MSTIEIRVMTKKDSFFALNLIDSTGWGNTQSDIDRNLSYEPEGCFVASKNGVDIGIVNSFLYGEIGFIGNLIVKPDARGEGVGAVLMKSAMNRLTSNGALTIMLDAVPKAIPLYRRLGFKELYKSLRYSGTPSVIPCRAAKPMRFANLEQISLIDQRYFGLDRKQKLTRVLQDFPEFCFVSEFDDEVKGYIMAKRGATSVRVGPWICDPKYPELARQLLVTLTSQIGRDKLWIGIPEENRVSVDIVESLGLQPLPSSLRMFYGSYQKREDTSGIFGIGAPDKG